MSRKLEENFGSIVHFSQLCPGCLQVRGDTLDEPPPPHGTTIRRRSCSTNPGTTSVLAKRCLPVTLSPSVRSHHTFREEPLHGPVFHLYSKHSPSARKTTARVGTTAHMLFPVCYVLSLTCARPGLQLLFWTLEKVLWVLGHHSTGSHLDRTKAQVISIHTAYLATTPDGPFCQVALSCRTQRKW